MINPTLLSLLQSDAVPDGAAKYTGMDAATLTSTLQSLLVTYTPIDLPTLRQWLADTGIGNRLSRTFASPVFAAVITGASLPLAATTDQLASSLAYILGPNSSLDTTNSVYGPKTYDFLQLMISVNAADAAQSSPSGIGMTPDEVTAFLAFGGGLKYGPNSPSLADVTDTMGEVERRAKWMDRDADRTAAQQDFKTTILDPFTALDNSRGQKIDAGINTPGAIAPDDLAALDSQN